MKKVLFLILLLTTNAYADSKITAFVNDHAPTSDDLMVTVHNPGGTAVNKKVTLGTLFNLIDTSSELASVVIDETGSGAVVFANAPTMDFGLGTLEVPHSGSLPGTCNIGDAYQDQDATSGQQWYLCETANNWVQQGGAGGATGWTDSGTSVYLTTSSDNVGIGTVNPAQKFVIEQDSTFQFQLREHDDSAAKATLAFIKSRGTTASQTVVAASDIPGNITFSGYDGSTNQASSAIQTIVDGAPSAGVMPIALQLQTGTTSGNRATAIHISSTQNVGIGTASPVSILNVSEGTGPILTLRRGDTTASAGDSLGKLSWNNNDTNLSTQPVYATIEGQVFQTVTTDAAAGDLIFSTTGTTAGGSPTERLRIKHDGTVQVAGIYSGVNAFISSTTPGSQAGTTLCIGSDNQICRCNSCK